MAKVERKNILTKYQQQFNPNRQQLPLMNPMTAFGNVNHMGMPAMPYNMGHPMAPKQKNVTSIYQQPMPYENKSKTGAKPIPSNNQQQLRKEDNPDIEYFNSIEDDSTKKEYLGEFIFKKISNHSLIQTKNLTIDNIGKITGMILGIDDLNEILDICRDDDNLTGRIVEALSLLNI